MTAGVSAFVHGVSRSALGYRLQQYLAAPTTARFRALIQRHVAATPGERVLDIACGVGTYSQLLRGTNYYGCDISPDYIEAARAHHPGRFDVMDCCQLTYDDGFFSHVLSVAATHHLDDRQLDAMVSGALRVCDRNGSLHVIDAVLPIGGNVMFKRMWFGLDVGRFPRTREALSACLARHGRVEQEEIVPGPLHDCVYFRVRHQRGESRA